MRSGFKTGIYLSFALFCLTLAIYFNSFEDILELIRVISEAGQFPEF